MPGTRRRPQKEEPEPEEQPQQQQQHEAAGTSDDEAPEEIGLTSGKAIALQRSKTEKQGRAAAQEQRKTRRRTLQERNEKQKRAKQGSSAGDEGLSGGAEAAGSLHGNEVHGNDEDGGDLLPPEVLAALQNRRSLAERQAAMVSQALQQSKEQPGSQNKRRKVLDQVEKGPVTVQVLRAAKRMAAASRSNFKKEQLLGAGAQQQIKRSHDMLRPAGAARRGPAVKFT